jgi:hypothetical protein
MKKHLIIAGLAAGLLAGAGVTYAMDDDSVPASSSRVAWANSVSLVSAESGTDETDETDDTASTDASDDATSECGGRGMGGAGLTTVAEVLGLTEDEVRAAIEDGSTLAALADANDSSADELIDALVAEMKTHLDEHVADGDITEEEATTRLTDAVERITEFVNDTQEAGPLGRGGHGGRDGHGGPGGQGAHGDGAGNGAANGG